MTVPSAGSWSINSFHVSVMSGNKPVVSVKLALCLVKLKSQVNK